MRRPLVVLVMMSLAGCGDDGDAQRASDERIAERALETQERVVDRAATAGERVVDRAATAGERVVDRVATSQERSADRMMDGMERMQERDLEQGSDSRAAFQAESARVLAQQQELMAAMAGSAPPPGFPAMPPSVAQPALPMMVEPESTACATARVRLLGVDRRRSVPLHLPRGGWRVRLRIVNDGDHAIGLPAVSRAIFMDHDRVVVEPQGVLDPNDWFMPFDVPPHAAREIGVTFGPELGERALDAVRIEGVHLTSEPLRTCTVDETEVSGDGPAR